MKKQSLKFGIADDAKFPRRLRDIPTHVRHPSFWERYGDKVKLALGYGAVAAGYGLAVYMLVTPAHAAGAFGIDVKVVRVSPSVTYFGDTREGRKLKADVARDQVRHQNSMEKMEREYELKRALEADKAYYKKLADQRKGRK